VFISVSKELPQSSQFVRYCYYYCYVHPVANIKWYCVSMSCVLCAFWPVLTVLYTVWMALGYTGVVLVVGSTSRVACTWRVLSVCLSVCLSVVSVAQEFEGFYWAEAKRRIQQKKQENLKLVCMCVCVYVHTIKGMLLVVVVVLIGSGSEICSVLSYHLQVNLHSLSSQQKAPCLCVAYSAVRAEKSFRHNRT